MENIGFGGSCHWCTEAIFRSLKGVADVQQGWVSPAGELDAFSEAVILRFDPEIISLATLIEVHLHTHSCTSQHAMRSKYRSAVYAFDDKQAGQARLAIQDCQKDFAEPIITEVLPFGDFKLNSAEFLDYYYSNPEKPFCTTYIDPKLRIILEKFADAATEELVSRPLLQSPGRE